MGVGLESESKLSSGRRSGFPVSGQGREARPRGRRRRLYYRGVAMDPHRARLGECASDGLLSLNRAVSQLRDENHLTNQQSAVHSQPILTYPRPCFP